MNLYTKDNFNEIVSALKKGEVIALPTDTVFGLAVIYDNEESINKLKKAKERDAHKPLPMMCDSLEMIERYTVLSDRERKIIKAFCPNALTLVLKVKEDLPKFVNNGLDTIAIRVPDDDFILSIIKELDKPLLVTSANISGEENMNKWQDVEKKLGKRIDGLLKEDAKSLIASTIVDLSKEEMTILRIGKIKEEDIQEVLNA